METAEKLVGKMKSMESDRSHLPLEENEEWVILGRCGLNFLNIAKIEVQAALARIPELVFLYLLRLPALILMWVSFSLLPAWAVFQLGETVFGGLFTFFLLQAILVSLISRITRHKLKESSLPASREYAARIVSLILTEPEPGEAASYKNGGETNDA